MINSRRLIWTGHVARMLEGRSVFKILTGKPTGRDHQEGLGGDGKTMLEWILKKWVSILVVGLVRLRIGTIGESL